MKIIDRKTGKRFDKAEAKRLKEVDPVKANPHKELEVDENSPMDPPSAYDTEIPIPKPPAADMPPVLQQFIDEHRAAEEVISDFDKALSEFKETEYKLNESINNAFHKFFEFFDDNLMPHNRNEEKVLFGELHKYLIESGEHSIDEFPKTSIDIMEDDHIKFIQLGALTFNMLGLAPRMADERSRMFVFDVAWQNGRELVEMLNLHIYREENILFPLAQRLIPEEKLNEMAEELKKL